MTLPLFELDEWFATTEDRFDLSLSHSGCQPQTVADLLDEDDMRSFAEVTPKEIESLGPELAGFLSEFSECFGRSEPRNKLAIYVRGHH